MQPSELIWMNGEFVRWEDATVHVLTHGLHYGTGVFEGIRCYDTEIGPAIFRHTDHLDRLEKSAGLYEPVHGSAPDIAGTGKANPLATLLSVALMLRYGLGMHGEAARLEQAVEAALAEGLRTPDLAGGEGTREVGTDEMTEAVIARL